MMKSGCTYGYVHFFDFMLCGCLVLRVAWWKIRQPGSLSFDFKRNCDERDRAHSVNSIDLILDW